MGSRLKPINLILGLLLLAGVAGSAFEAYQYWHIQQINQALLHGRAVSGNDYPFNQKFAAAYLQGEQKDYKHAVQSYSQLLETPLSNAQQAKIQFNIGNNLFLAGLARGQRKDGSIMDEARYAYSQARIAYEQALRLAPDSQAAKFNLSLLHSVLPSNMQGAEKEQSTMQLSNLPIGLP
ncbi:MAG TPA: hypothetical protein VFX01_08800 [Methylophilaceae bacterium]|nr:hypothetical protein [Methylophilaceae bacterium]